MGGTYHHSLAFLYVKKEFEDQVRLQRELIEDLFGEAPLSFVNTGLIYNDDLRRPRETGIFTPCFRKGRRQSSRGEAPMSFTVQKGAGG